MKKIIEFIKNICNKVFGKKQETLQSNVLTGSNFETCPICKKGKMNVYHDHGLVEISMQWYSGGMNGTHVSGQGKAEYQFHYYTCENGCSDSWKMIEYRKTPSWWDDFWGCDCPFKQGDIIQKYKNDEMPTEKYISHKITRW